jgi:hypothetical protein
VLRRIGVLTLVAGAGLGGMSAALAANPATPEQQAVIAPAAGFSPGCSRVLIAESDPAWATAAPTNAAGCPQSNGTTVLHLQGGAWRAITAGSDFGYCPIAGVPATISRELALCRAVTPGSYVLGSAAFAPNGTGFGTSKPRTIFNGGVPSGLANRIHWRHWGAQQAIGIGKNAIYRPGGGYYARRATIKLRASRRGRCPGSDQPAYRLLEARLPKRPGGKLGPWFRWSGAKSICELP